MIKIAFHWPHARFALGWEQLLPSEDYEYNTFNLFLLVFTISIDYK